MRTDTTTDDRDPSSFPLLSTKLHRPPIPTGSILRQRLHEILDRALELPLTVVSAPAGYGKSTLVSQWAESMDAPCAWLSLDTADSDLRLFLRYFLAALESVRTNICPETRELSASPGPVPIAVLGGTLANELDAIDSPLVLVLDDYHRIDPASDVHELLRFLLDHPPQYLRLVLACRSDPPMLVSVLRGRGQVTEIRLRDLKFTSAESAECLAHSSIVNLSEEALANLERQTEGWIVALRLVALHLQQIDDPEAALRALRGGVQQTSEYLLREVIDRLPTLTREWILKTAVLDRFCPALCDAVAAPTEDSEGSGYDGAQFVHALVAGNIFTIPLDLQGHWFRFHHLFQEMLQEQLEARATPREIAALHVHASEWFEGQGFIDESLKHALAAKEVDLAVQLVARHWHAMLDADRWYVLDHWMSLMPESVIQQHAELLIVRAWLLMHSFQFEALSSLLDQIESLIADDSEAESMQGEISLCRGYSLFLLGEGQDSLKHVAEALERIPVSLYEARAQSEIIFALSSQMVGRKQQGLRSLDECLAHYDSPEELRKTRLLVTYVFIHFIDADLAEADLANGRLRELVERTDYTYAHAWSDYLQGLIHLQRGEWDAAAGYLGRAVEQRFIHFNRAAADAITGLMLVHQVTGREDEAQSSLQMLREYVRSQGDPALWPMVSSAESRLSIMQGRPDPARGWLDAIALPTDPAMLWWLDVPSVTGCRTMLAEGSPEALAAAEAQLRVHVEANEVHHNGLQLVQVLSLLAMVLEKQGRTDEALPVLQRALTLAEPGGIAFPFLELGAPMATLLGKLPQDTASGAMIELIATAGARPAEPSAPEHRWPDHAAIDLLTDREQQIVGLLAQRLQYKEIATRLSISPQTVNSHLKNAYQKLGVNNRRQAVARASELGLLSPT